MCGGGGGRRRQGRVKIGGRDTRCFGGETERGKRKTKEGRRGRDASRWGDGREGGSVREERCDEEAWDGKMKRLEEWVKRHEKIFGESQWETRRGGLWRERK